MLSRIVRDMLRREQVQNFELLRKSYKYIARNQTLPANVRYQAQLRLHQLPTASCPTQLVTRCIVSGRGKAVLKDFKYSRIVFREKALNGEIEGVMKSRW
jgi:small subunit ribosomal protein S14